MTKNEFEAWVSKTVQDFYKSDRYRYQRYKQKIVVVDCKTGETATAKCHEDDEFDTDIGVAIAFARIKGWDVPEIDNIVLSKPRDGETFFCCNSR